jgi:alkylhydroperoxidase/carboxymuconolactone decarboxylase family protein YurZ
MRASLDQAGIVHQDPALRQAAGQAFYNTSKFTLRELRARASQQQLKADFEANRGYWSPIWDGVLKLSPDFFEAYLEYSSVPWRQGVLAPKIKELIYCAFDCSATHLWLPGLKLHMRNALGHGATPLEIMEVIQIASALGAHAFEYAMPALRARGMTATVYTVSGWVGRPGYMTWDQLRQIRDWGMSVQSHSQSHPFLSELDAPRLRTELLESKAALDRELGQDTAEIAFPGGDAPARGLRYLIGECGYRVAVGTRWGVNTHAPDPGRFVRRCTVRGDITVEQARRFIGGDPWLSLTTNPREAALRTLWSTLGPSRYARWRRWFLDALVGDRGLSRAE